jgi:hypothetical protein
VADQLFVNGERATVMSESNGRTRGSPNDEIHEVWFSSFPVFVLVGSTLVSFGRKSRLRPDAIEPVTRVGDRGALSARSFRSDSGAQFGSLGLTAAAYKRWSSTRSDWLAGKRTLPSETLAYVRIVTGHSAEDCKRQNAKEWQVTIPGVTPCVEMTKLTAKPAFQTTTMQHKSTVIWVVQLICDRSGPMQFPAIIRSR